MRRTFAAVFLVGSLVASATSCGKLLVDDTETSLPTAICDCIAGAFPDCAKVVGERFEDAEISASYLDVYASNGCDAECNATKRPPLACTQHEAICIPSPAADESGDGPVCRDSFVCCDVENDPVHTGCFVTTDEIRDQGGFVSPDLRYRGHCTQACSTCTEFVDGIRLVLDEVRDDAVGCELKIKGGLERVQKARVCVEQAASLAPVLKCLAFELDLRAAGVCNDECTKCGLEGPGACADCLEATCLDGVCG